ncbi:hypothetical protein BH20ACI2_BH20ACI2_14980 [soil metagenome]
MGEDFDPLITESAVKTISNRGIVIVMLVLIILGTLAGFAFGGRGVGAGVLTGGFLSVVNYFWLERSTRALFEQRAASTTTLLAAKYVLRYVAIGAVLLLIYMTGAVPIAAVIAGLSSFAIAVVIQGLKNIFTSSF